MDMNLSEEQSMIQDMARKFSNSELAPQAALLDQKSSHKILIQNVHKLAQLGFMGLNVNSEYGGTQAGPVAFSLAMTEIGRGCAATAATMSVTNMVGEVIQSVASEAQKSATFQSYAVVNTALDLFVCLNPVLALTLRKCVPKPF